MSKATDTIENAVFNGNITILNSGNVDLGLGDIEVQGTVLTDALKANTTSGTISCSSPILFSDTTKSTSSVTGSVIISGGIGVSSNLFIGGTAISGAPVATGSLINTNTFTFTNNTTAAAGTATQFYNNVFAAPTIAATNTTVTTTTAANIYISGAPIAGTNMTLTNSYALYSAAGLNFFGGNTTFSGVVTHSNATAASSQVTGAVVITGGVGIGGSLYAGNIFSNGVQLVNNTYTAGTNISIAANVVSVIAGPTFSGITTVSNAT